MEKALVIMWLAIEIKLGGEEEKILKKGKRSI